METGGCLFCEIPSRLFVCRRVVCPSGEDLDLLIALPHVVADPRQDEPVVTEATDIFPACVDHRLFDRVPAIGRDHDDHDLTNRGAGGRLQPTLVLAKTRIVRARDGGACPHCSLNITLSHQGTRFRSNIGNVAADRRSGEPGGRRSEDPEHRRKGQYPHCALLRVRVESQPGVHYTWGVDSSRTGLPCKNPAVRGTNVCMTHGGAAPQVRARVALRLAMLMDPRARSTRTS